MKLGNAHSNSDRRVPIRRANSETEWLKCSEQFNLVTASTWNTLLDIAQERQARSQNQSGEARSHGLPAGIVLVKNASGADRARFDILGIGGPSSRQPSASRPSPTAWPWAAYRRPNLISPGAVRRLIRGLATCQAKAHPHPVLRGHLLPSSPSMSSGRVRRGTASPSACEVLEGTLQAFVPIDPGFPVEQFSGSGDIGPALLRVILWQVLVGDRKVLLAHQLQ